MKRWIASICLLAFLGGCSSVPLTGRKQLLLVSDQDVLSASLTQYSDYMKTAKKTSSGKDAAMVTRVGKKIAAATEQYLRQNGMQDEIKNFSWEFNLVKDDQVNAFCMPGGKIVVYEGLMNLVDSDDELAVVLGHEVAHAVAKHSNERMSQQLVAQYGAQILSAAVANKSAAVQNVASSDMGLILMTMAGYNPDVAVHFWEKMSAGSGGKVPEFMSTHPSDSRRISDIQKELPAIKKSLGK